MLLIVVVARCVLCVVCWCLSWIVVCCVYRYCMSSLLAAVVWCVLCVACCVLICVCCVLCDFGVGCLVFVGLRLLLCVV